MRRTVADGLAHRVNKDPGGVQVLPALCVKGRKQP